MKTFEEYLESKKPQRVWVYKCPQCGGESYNGNPEAGTLFRGGAKCQTCGLSFSAIGKDPITKEGPVLKLKRQ